MLPPERLITRKEVLRLVPYTQQHLLRLQRAGKFPKHVRIGANRVGYVLSEVKAWIDERIAARSAAAEKL